MTICPGCGLQSASDGGAPSDRLQASWACWQLYGELAAYDMARFDPGFLHQEAVDAYEAQHAGGPAKPITAVFALVGLYLFLEHRFTGRQVQQAHVALGRRHLAWPHWDSPAQTFRITVADVLRAAPGQARDSAIRDWAECTWQAWAERHEDVRELCGRLLGIAARP